MKEFVKLDKYGQLYVDKVLFESYFPIIFTCINDHRDIFISVCCQNNEKGCKWLLGKTNGTSIVRVLRDEITIRQLLLECSSEKISVDYVENGYIIAYNNSDWDENSPYLPKEDSYMYAEDGEFEDEMNYFSSLDYHVNYNTELCKYAADSLETINNGIELTTDSAAAAVSSIVNTTNIAISSEVVSTLKVFGKLCSNLVLNTEKYRADQENYKPICSSTFSVLPEDLSIKVASDDNIYADAA